MSIVNRDPNIVKSYTDTTSSSLENIKFRVDNMFSYLENIMNGMEEANLNKEASEILELMRRCLDSVRNLEDVNFRLAKESSELISVVGADGFVRIDTDKTENALRKALLCVDEFYNFVVNHIDSLVGDIRTKLIYGKLEELKSAVTGKINLLNEKKQQLRDAANRSGADGEESCRQEYAMISLRIDELKRIIESADDFAAKLEQHCINLEQIKNPAYKTCELFRRVHASASDKISAIKNAVDN